MFIDFLTQYLSKIYLILRRVHLDNITNILTSSCKAQVILAKIECYFEMIVGVLTTCHLVLQTQPHVIFFLWCYVKDQIYVPPLPASIPKLKVRVRTAIETITADMLYTVWNELDYRVDVCRITKGTHIEHL